MSLTLQYRKGQERRPGAASGFRRRDRLCPARRRMPCRQRLLCLAGARCCRPFLREVVEAMLRHNERPIIFALSNPIEHDECLPEQAYAWSGGKAIYAGGGQFPSFHLDGQTVADWVTPEQLKLGMLFPPHPNILEVEVKTAARVAKLVFDADLARVDRPADMEAFIRQHLYKPEYRTLP